jgi:hypothetical protein
VIFSFGITLSARNESVWNGAGKLQPSASAAFTHARDPSTTSAKGASDKRPATGSGSSAYTPRSAMTQRPPPISARR